MKIFYLLCGLLLLCLGIVIGWIVNDPNTNATKQVQTDQSAEKANGKTEDLHEAILWNQLKNEATRNLQIQKESESDKYIRVTLRKSESDEEGDQEKFDGFRFEFIDMTFRDKLTEKYKALEMEIPQLYHAGTIDFDKYFVSAKVTFPEPLKLKGVSWVLLGQRPNGAKEIIFKIPF